MAQKFEEARCEVFIEQVEIKSKKYWSLNIKFKNEDDCPCVSIATAQTKTEALRIARQRMNAISLIHYKIREKDLDHQQKGGKYDII